MIEPKPLFEERMKKLLPDYEKFLEIIRKEPQNAIRCNTLKIKPSELIDRLEKKGWKMSQPWPKFPEVMIIESELKPGELGKTDEHMMGYYYVQELSSMLPMLALNPQPGELVLDICAAPGSKTTQASAMMNNTGTIVANDRDIGRMIVLASNLERFGATNTVITRNDAVQLCEKLNKVGMKFDKILLDVPCSGEGTIRSSPKTLIMWNPKMIIKLGKLQRKIASSAVSLLRENGTMVYSTCTHAPEENEAVVNFLIERFGLELEPANLPVKCRPGLLEWERDKFQKSVEHACRIYPQDNNTEGFFVAKLKRKNENKKIS